ncbi:uncharacterized protein BDR25DRAFT_362888 [Lindgomyces ingoldianus]|uniref:Uncharacterized protein n=1 Tax=Lindgomyces ingoldianus TaxID=673940 RepID=A0ACB6QB47_9PLEO|nr:uncharacterized protein BDR25DRAFT_362888 [Lindgomyces ingoldianus]KAF2463342.1 hypothetical protein BDR25DRAFT_362888 [Lindgomyces ingoldianus]
MPSLLHTVVQSNCSFLLKCCLSPLELYTYGYDEDYLSRGCYEQEVKSSKRSVDRLLRIMSARFKWGASWEGFLQSPMGVTGRYRDIIEGCMKRRGYRWHSTKNLNHLAGVTQASNATATKSKSNNTLGTKRFHSNHKTSNIHNRRSRSTTTPPSRTTQFPTPWVSIPSGPYPP